MPATPTPADIRDVALRCVSQSHITATRADCHVTTIPPSARPREDATPSLSERLLEREPYSWLVMVRGRDEVTCEPRPCLVHVEDLSGGPRVVDYAWL